MFRKLFHNSGVEKLVEGTKSYLDGESSISEESEIITVAEIPKAEKRFFLRRPLKARAVDYDHQMSLFRTFDPFDIRLSLKRSSSFPSKSKPYSSEHSTLKLPRSKSVHFAENLTTYHEFKPNVSLSIEDLESTFEEYCRSRREKTEKENTGAERGESEEDTEEYIDEDEGEEQDEKLNFQGEKSKRHQIIKTELIDGEESSKANNENRNQASLQKTNNQRADAKQKRSMRVAGQNLQSVFTSSIETERTPPSEVLKVLSFDTSDSTDVDLVTEAKKDKDWVYLYMVYEQICDLQQFKAKCFADTCETLHLKSEISCGIADIGDIVSSSRNQLELAKSEIFELKRIFQEVSLELQSQASIVHALQEENKAFQEAIKLQTDVIDQVKALQEKIEVLEEEKQKQVNLAHTLSLKVDVGLREKLANNERTIARLQTEVQEVEKWKSLEAFQRQVNAELLAKLELSKNESEGLQQFQEAERKLLQSEFESARAQSVTFKAQLQEKVALVQKLESSLKAQKANNDQQIREASMMIKDFGKGYEEKSQHFQKIVDALESTAWPKDNEIPRQVTQSDIPKRKPSVGQAIPSSPIPELDRAYELIRRIRKAFSDLTKQDSAKARKLGEIETSNSMAVELLAVLIKGTFETLTPIIDKDCAEQITNLYYDFSDLEVMTQEKKAIVMVLCTFILNAQRELMRLHQKNERMLETEIQDRLKYQQQVLDSFTRIVKQVMDNSRGPPRLLGIRGHSSPKKTKSHSRK